MAVKLFDQSKFPLTIVAKIFRNLHLSVYSFIIFLTSNKFNLQASLISVHSPVHHWDFHFVLEKSLFPFGRARQLAQRGSSNLIKDPKTPSGIICIIFIKPFSLDTQLNFNKHRAASYIRADRRREWDTDGHKGRKNTISHARQCAHWQFLSPPCPERCRRHAATALLLKKKHTPTLVLLFRVVPL